MPDDGLADADADPDRRATVTYEGLPTVDVFERIKGDLAARLPLTDLQWKPVTRSLRVIDSLQIDFKAHQAVGSEQRPTYDLLDANRPYLHLLFVACEDSDVYRTTTRQQIRTWLDGIAARSSRASSGQEWLIVHITSGRTGSTKFYQRKSTISDKIRADFNTAKRDRCVSLLDGGPEAGSTWTDFLQKMKEGIVATFESNVAAYEEDLRKLDSQRTLPGWNFCTFFIQKEGLAFSFEAMTLYEDALIQYDELEASFYQTLKDANLAWFGQVGGNSRGDDRTSIFSTSQKPYRDLIKTNAITLFDFRNYLFARQALLLGKLHRIMELARRGQRFVSAVSAMLRTEQDPDNALIQSWVYSACLELLERTRELSGTIEREAPPEHHLVVAELTDLARRQLDQLGILATFLPPEYPFSMSTFDTPINTRRRPNVTDSSDDEETSKKRKRRSIANVRQPKTLVLLESQFAFDAAYLKTCSECLQAYNKAHRSKGAAQLSLNLAAFDERDGRLDKAQESFAALPPTYFDTGWSIIESAILARCIHLQRNMNAPRDYLLSLLALLRSAWSKHPPIDNAGIPDPEFILNELCTVSAGLEKDFAVISFPAFTFKSLAPLTTPAGSIDGIHATFSIINNLAVAVNTDEIRLKMCTNTGEFLWFSHKNTQSGLGVNEIQTFCSSPYNGRLLLEVVQIRLSRVVFQYHFRSTSERGQPWSLKSLPSDAISTVARRDCRAVTASLEGPDRVALDEPRHCRIRIWSGRETLTRIDVQATDPTKRVVFDYKRAECESSQVVQSTAHIRLETVPPNAWHSVKVPYVCTGSQRDVPVDVTLRWTTGQGDAAVIRTLKIAQTLPFALPFSIDVQDYFRSESVITRMRVSPGLSSSMLVKSADLVAPPSFACSSARKSGSELMIVPAGSSLTALFSLSLQPDVSVEGAIDIFPDLFLRKASENSKLRLCLVYCTLADNYTHSLQDLIKTTLNRRKLELPPPLVEILARRWSSVLIKQTSPEMPLLKEDVVQSLQSAIDFAKIQHVFDPIEKCDDLVASLKEAAENFQTMSVTPWRTFEIPCEVPTVQILVTANIIVPTEHRLGIGQAINATLTLDTTFRWAHHTRQTLAKEGQRMLYSLQADHAHWALGGRVSGEYLAKDDSNLSVDFLLVPLQSGSLPLPRINVQPIANTLDGQLTYLPTSELHYANSAQRVEVLPRHTKSTFLIRMTENVDRL